MGHGHANFHPMHIPSIRPLPKPRIDMDALQKAVGIIGGVIALSPIGKLVETGIITVADIASNGKASKFINNGHEVNRTLNFVPGGMLAQQLSNDVSNGRSGSTLDKFLPDPMKMLIKNTVKIGETIVLHPSQTLNVGKDIGISNVHDLHNIVHNYQDVVIKTKPKIHHLLSDMVSGIKSIEQVHHEKHLSHLPAIFHMPHTETHHMKPPSVHTMDHPIPHTIPKEADPIISPSLPSIFIIPHTETHPIIPSHIETKPLSYIEPSPISIPIMCLGVVALGALMYRSCIRKNGMVFGI